jgi:hypothetical protein
MYCETVRDGSRGARENHNFDFACGIAFSLVALTPVLLGLSGC